MNNISPYESFERALRRWWIVAVCMVIGGLIGWGFSFILKPVYEARATYLITLDTDQIARLVGRPSGRDLQFYEINPYYQTVEEVFYDLDTRKALVEQAHAAGIPLTLSDFTQSSFYVDRQGGHWTAIVRNSDPDRAAGLANTWLTIADKGIREAQAHGIRAEALRLKIDAVQACFAKQDFAAANQCAGTDFSTPDELQSFIQDSMTQQQAEANLSLGVSPLLSVAIKREATPPEQPVLYVRSEITLAGALAGLIVGTLLVQIIPERKRDDE